MPKSKKTQAALAWLESGEAPTERSPEVVAALILLAHDLPLDVRLEALAGADLGRDIEMALLVLAQRADSLELMIHFRDQASHKATAKQAKRFLFRAKQRGAEVPADNEPARAVRLACKPDPLPSYCSTFDREGGQVVVLGGWDDVDGAWALVGIVQGDHGLNTVAWLPKMSRSRLKNVLSSLAGERREELVEVAADFAAGRLKWALCQAESTSSRIDGDRSRVRRLLQEVPALTQFQRVDVELTADALEKSEALLDDSCFEAWLLSLGPLLETTPEPLRAAEGVGDGEAGHAALLQALLGHADEWFNAERRSTLAQRLEITAMLLANLNRTSASTAALAVARALAPAGVPVSEIPLFRAALKREAPIAAWCAERDRAAAAL